MDAEEQKIAKRTLKTFGWASFWHDVGSDIVFSVWPIFVTQALGAPVSALGWIDGLGDAIVAMSQAISGWWSDRIGKRKVFVWVGYLVGGLARLGYALAPTWGWLIPFRMMDRTGKMRGSPRDAILSDQSTTENRGRNFGYLRMMDNAGAIVGTLTAVLLLGVLGHRTLFLLAAIPSVLVAIMVYKRIHEAKSQEKKIFKGFHFRDLSPNLVRYFVGSGIFALGSFSYSFLLLYANHSGFMVITVPLLYLLYTVVAALGSLPAGKLADKWGRRPTLLLALAFWAVALLAFAQDSWWAIIIAFVLYGAHLATLGPVQTALAAELAPADHVAGTLGSYQMVMGLVALPASVIAGYLWSIYGATVPLLFSFSLTIVAGAVLSTVKRPGDNSSPLSRRGN